MPIPEPNIHTKCFQVFSLCFVADVDSAKCLAQSQWSASLTLFKSFYISICNFFIFTKSILRPSVRLYAGPSDPFPNLEQQQQREKDFRLCGWQIRKINKKKLWIFPMIFLNVDGMCVRLSVCLSVCQEGEWGYMFDQNRQRDLLYKLGKVEKLSIEFVDVRLPSLPCLLFANVAAKFWCVTTSASSNLNALEPLPKDTNLSLFSKTLLSLHSLPLPANP